jgi:hypothetical protein
MAGNFLRRQTSTFVGESASLISMADGNASVRPPHTHGADLDLALGQPCMLCASGRLIITVSVRLGGPQIGDDYLKRKNEMNSPHLAVQRWRSGLGEWSLRAAEEVVLHE